MLNRAPAPAGPAAIPPLVFQGITEAGGSLVQIRGSGDGLEEWVDGSLIERIAAQKDFASRDPVIRFRLNGNLVEETFDTSDEALDALAAFRDEGGSPPWVHAVELLADGLIDVHFELTPAAIAPSRARGGAEPRGFASAGVVEAGT